MEINSDHIVELIQGQARIEQSVTDIKENMTKSLTFLHNEHEKLSKRVSKVEKRSWYATGLGAGIGAALSYFGIHIGR
jgi:hypothetical protein